MVSKGGFKKPTIRKHGRAYVRLYGYFDSPESWLVFLARYSVRHRQHGVRQNGDCAVSVFDATTGVLADLGLDIPIDIAYHTFTAERSFWNETFASATHWRYRTTEVGASRPSKDETVPRPVIGGAC